MLWKGRRQSDNIEDVRDQSGGGFPGGFGRNSGGPVRIPIGSGSRGGLSIGTIIILIVLYFGAKALFGVDLLQILSGEGPGSQPGYGNSVSNSANDDEMKQFVATVLAETEDTWSGIFQSMGKTYEKPKLVLFGGSWNSACGSASAASGPFYCPNDRKVYLDMAFFQQLSKQFGASGEFADAYVIAHEVGHHVQNLTGILPKFNQMRQHMSEAQANQMSVRVELQADCLAGIWGHYTEQKGLLEKGDLEDALNAAQQIGDDTLQKRAQGYVVPESFNHGTSKQRVTWFKRGFDSGKLADCDTFNNPV
ncbi:neutral zinc metallopeptidase [Mesorhizobium sp. BAC0120]|uniref:KPN_02809 family neutral zinc metallopeptidase n=1 Tax=Mesorhizobium sp. BAC0120 TaxID=3090670 RepID=UPI00298D2B22|nr:neutral zinc metallopeptidase [Mesorhizobium sp. BAC0120]MDW6022412.1 neutral zinc metallopeptidase [Mesorhizobium sp. BAC0120]